MNKKVSLAREALATVAVFVYFVVAVAMLHYVTARMIGVDPATLRRALKMVSP